MTLINPFTHARLNRSSFTVYSLIISLGLSLSFMWGMNDFIFGILSPSNLAELSQISEEISGLPSSMGAHPSFASVPLAILSVILLSLANLMISVKRIRDINRSGIWIVGILMLGPIGSLYLALAKGSEGANDYGPDPLVKESRDMRFVMDPTPWLKKEGTPDVPISDSSTSQPRQYP